MTNLTDLEHEAIAKKDMAEFDQKRLRGTGYDMMRLRDKGWGTMRNRLGGEVTIEWNIDEAHEEPEDGVAYTKIPADMFKLTIGKTEALVDKAAFQKLFRWV
jgi:hypothetical protein